MSKINDNPFDETNNEVMVINKSDLAGVSLIEQLKNPNADFFCSMQDDGTRKSKIKIFNAINSADKAVADMIGETIEVVDVVAHPVNLMDDDGNEIIALRTVLVDKNGVGYTAVSVGITSALSRIFSLIGSPEDGRWHKEPVKMKIKQVKTNTGNNKVNTIELV